MAMSWLLLASGRSRPIIMPTVWLLRSLSSRFNSYTCSSLPSQDGGCVGWMEKWAGALLPTSRSAKRTKVTIQMKNTLQVSPPSPFLSVLLHSLLPLDKDSDDSGVGDNSAIEPSTLESLRSFVAPEITAEAYRAIDSYQANGPGQVSFEIGDTIHVLDKLEDGRLGE